MRQESIRMSYIGELSVNHRLGKRKGGGYYLKPEVVAWNEEFGWLLKRLHLEDWKLPLTVKCDGFFRDERSACDIHNLSKITDVIQEVSGINDKYMKWVDGTREIKKGEPYLLITITENKEE